MTFATIPVQYIEVTQNVSAVQVQGLVLDISDSVGWVMNSNGVFEYSLYDNHITVNSIVHVTPDNDDVATVEAARILPECKIFEDNFVTIYSEVEPVANITVTLNIWKKSAGTEPTIGSVFLPIGTSSEGSGSYTLPLAASGTRGGIQIGYSASGANLALQLSAEKAFIALTKAAIEAVLTGAISSHSHSYDNYVSWLVQATGGSTLAITAGVTLNITGAGSVTVTRSGNTITISATDTNTWVANALGAAGYVAAASISTANLVWKCDETGNPGWRIDQTGGGDYILPLAANGTRGGIQIGYSASGANLALQLSSEKAFIALTKAAIEAVLTGTITSHTHNYTNYAGWLIATDTAGSDEVVDSYDTVLFTNTTGIAITKLTFASTMTMSITIRLHNYPTITDPTTAYFVPVVTSGGVHSKITLAVLQTLIATPYTLPLAANGTRGGIQIGFSATGASLPLFLSAEKAYITLTKSAIEAIFTGTITSHAHNYEPPLGNPGANGYVLASTTGGVRSWVALPSESLWTDAGSFTYRSDIYDNVSIGKNTNSGNKLEVWGNTLVSGNITSGESYRGSSREIKHDIEPYDGDAMQIINDTKICTYKLNSDNSFGIGFISEDTHKWLSGEEQKRHAFGNHLGLLTKAVQEQDKEIQALKKELAELREMIKDLKNGRG